MTLIQESKNLRKKSTCAEISKPEYHMMIIAIWRFLSFGYRPLMRRFQELSYSSPNIVPDVHYRFINCLYHISTRVIIPNLLFSHFSLPMPSIPTFEGMSNYLTDIPIIAIISFAQSVSLAAIMAKKHKYSIDSNQVSLQQQWQNNDNQVSSDLSITAICLQRPIFRVCSEINHN